MGWVGRNLVEKANHSKYEPNVHNMLKVAIYANRYTIMIDATLSCKMDIKWHKTWVIAQVCKIT